MVCAVVNFSIYIEYMSLCAMHVCVLFHDRLTAAVVNVFSGVVNFYNGTVALCVCVCSVSVRY